MMRHGLITLPTKTTRPLSIVQSLEVFIVVVVVVVASLIQPSYAFHGIANTNKPLFQSQQHLFPSKQKSLLMTKTTTKTTTMQMVSGSTNPSGMGDYMVREFSMYEQLEEIVQLASQALPERPDGIVCVARYTSAGRPECQATEIEYERLARSNPATIFLRCFEEYDNAPVLMFTQANVQKFPTHDIFYGGNRVARVDGSNIAELQDVLNMYQFQNSKLDLFSEEASLKRNNNQWGDASSGASKDMNRTPRTTARFIPGYDWGSKKGFFDDQGEKVQQSFEDTFGNWVPVIDDDDFGDDDDDIPPKK